MIKNTKTPKNHQDNLEVRALSPEAFLRQAESIVSFEASYQLSQSNQTHRAKTKDRVGDDPNQDDSPLKSKEQDSSLVVSSLPSPELKPLRPKPGTRISSLVRLAIDGVVFEDSHKMDSPEESPDSARIIRFPAHAVEHPEDKD